VSSDLKRYGVLAGRYLGANTTLELGLGRSEQTFQFDCPPTICIAPGPISFENSRDSVDLEVFHVRRFRSLTYSLQGRVSETEFEGGLIFSSQGNSLQSNDFSTRVYSVAGELFPTNRLGVRVGYSRPDDDFLDSDGFDVAATWFFKPRIAVQFSLTRTSFGGAPVGIGDVDSAGVRFFGRL
jgi:hypothetical protein